MRIIGGDFKGQILKAPKGGTTRPTSSQLREAVFNICQHQIEGASFLDVFCGSGAMGIEALSRHAGSATFIDNHASALAALKDNLLKLHLEGTVLKLDALAALKKLEQQKKSFDMIYVDPPYEAQPKKPASAKSYASRILTLIDRSSLLKPEGILFIEEGGTFERRGALLSLSERHERSFGTSTLSLFYGNKTSSIT